MGCSPGGLVTRDQASEEIGLLRAHGGNSLLVNTKEQGLLAPRGQSWVILQNMLQLLRAVKVWCLCVVSSPVGWMVFPRQHLNPSPHAWMHLWTSLQVWKYKLRVWNIGHMWENGQKGFLAASVQGPSNTSLPPDAFHFGSTHFTFFGSEFYAHCFCVE